MRRYVNSERGGRRSEHNKNSDDNDDDEEEEEKGSAGEGSRQENEGLKKYIYIEMDSKKFDYIGLQNYNTPECPFHGYSKRKGERRRKRKKKMKRKS